jgi:hypothetical protein
MDAKLGAIRLGNDSGSSRSSSNNSRTRTRETWARLYEERIDFLGLHRLDSKKRVDQKKLVRGKDKKVQRQIAVEVSYGPNWRMDGESLVAGSIQGQRD